VVKARRDFIDGIGAVADLRANIVDELAQAYRYVVPGYPDVLVGQAKVACPFPRLAEHPAMHVADEPLVERVTAAAREQPIRGQQDVRFLEFVQLAL